MGTFITAVAALCVLQIEFSHSYFNIESLFQMKPFQNMDSRSADDIISQFQKLLSGNKGANTPSNERKDSINIVNDENPAKLSNTNVMNKSKEKSINQIPQNPNGKEHITPAPTISDAFSTQSFLDQIMPPSLLKNSDGNSIISIVSDDNDERQPYKIVDGTGTASTDNGLSIIFIGIPPPTAGANPWFINKGKDATPKVKNPSSDDGHNIRNESDRSQEFHKNPTSIKVPVFSPAVVNGQEFIFSNVDGSAGEEVIRIEEFTVAPKIQPTPATKPPLQKQHDNDAVRKLVNEMKSLLNKYNDL